MNDAPLGPSRYFPRFMRPALKGLKTRMLDAADRTTYVVRSLCGHDYYGQPDVRVRMAALGSGDGRWWLAPELLPAVPLIYSVGIGQDISFDLDAIQKLKAEIFAFDPTPISKAWLANQQIPEMFHHVDCGLGAFDGDINMTLPANHGVSYSPLVESNTEQCISFPVKTLATLMNELGHISIDVLKMDIEGAEYDVIQNLAEAGSRPGQILVEFHHRMLPHPVGIEKTHQAVALLRRLGYKLFHVSSRGLEYSFCHFNKRAFSTATCNLG